MKKLIILLSFIVVLTIGLLMKLKDFTNNIILNDINNSIVNIIKKEKFKLIDNSLNLKNIKQTNLEKQTLIWKGFFINNKWYILTNKHIVNNYSWTYLVNYNNKQYLARPIKISKNNDLALIKIDFNNKNYLKIIPKNNLYIGENIFFLNKNKFSSWNILKKNISINKNLNNLILTNIKLKSGDSWSPLFNKNYKVIWINSAISNTNKTYTILITKKILKEEFWF